MTFADCRGYQTLPVERTSIRSTRLLFRREGVSKGSHARGIVEMPPVSLFGNQPEVLVLVLAVLHAGGIGPDPHLPGVQEIVLVIAQRHEGGFSRPHFDRDDFIGAGVAGQPDPASVLVARVVLDEDRERFLGIVVHAQVPFVLLLVILGLEVLLVVGRMPIIRLDRFRHGRLRIVVLIIRVATGIRIGRIIRITRIPTASIPRPPALRVVTIPFHLFVLFLFGLFLFGLFLFGSWLFLFGLFLFGLFLFWLFLFGFFLFVLFLFGLFFFVFFLFCSF